MGWFNKRGRRGTNSIEFALSFPMYIFVVAAMIDASWMLVQKSAIDSASHLGCRDGATKDPGFNNANISTVQTYARDQSYVHLTEYGGQCNSCLTTVTVLYSNPARSLRCNMRTNYQPLFGLLPSGSIQSNAVVRMEFQR